MESCSATLEMAVKKIISDVDPRSIVLFGSAAREDWKRTSDIDLLVVAKRSLSTLKLSWELRQMEPSISISVYNEIQVKDSWKKGTLTALFIDLEGIVLFDTGFWKTLPNLGKSSFIDEIDRQFRIGFVYQDLDRIEGSLHFPYFSLYKSFKNIAFLSLARKNILEPRKTEAITKFYDSTLGKKDMARRILDLQGVIDHLNGFKAAPFDLHDKSILKYYFEKLKEVRSLIFR